MTAQTKMILIRLFDGGTLGRKIQWSTSQHFPRDIFPSFPLLCPLLPSFAFYIPGRAVTLVILHVLENQRANLRTIVIDVFQTWNYILFSNSCFQPSLYSKLMEHHNSYS